MPTLFLHEQNQKKKKPRVLRTLSRRKFLQGTGAALAVATAAPKIEAQVPAPTAATESVPRTTIRLTLNGAEQRLQVEDRWTQNEGDRRESKLRSMEQLSAAVGSNNDAANYLTSQILNDLLEQTPSKNVGRITVLNGLSGNDQAIVSRQGVLQGK